MTMDGERKYGKNNGHRSYYLFGHYFIWNMSSIIKFIT